ncbi:MAG: CDP-alcohol phosphatidyltransferase family protein, partial [Thermoplasmata archaeon]
MVLEGYRARVAPYIARVARPFLAWTPDRLSWLALALAAAAAVVAALVRWSTPLLFLPVALLIFLAGLFDVLDGEVARTTRRASVRGDFLDHVIDRYADLFIVLGIAVSGFANPILALLALASLLLTSYMGTQAQAVGQGRLYSGLLSRADRLVVLAVAAFLEFDWSLPWPWAPTEPWSRFHLGGFGFTVIDVAFLY